jgi:hypothetical protein
MESDQNVKRREKERGREGTSDSPDLRLDEIEDEIIDLVDVAEEGPPAADVAPSDEGGVGDDVEVENLELEAAGTPEELPLGTSEQEMREADEALGEAEQEFQSLLGDETDEPERVIDDLTEGDEETAEASEVADLFAADQKEVEKLPHDGPAMGEERGESLTEEAPSSDEEFFEGLFDDLEIDEEGAKAVADVPEEAPKKDEPAGDILDELRLESEMKTETEAPEPPAAVEELPEDLFADLDTSGRTSPEPPEAAPGAFPASGDSGEELTALIREHVEAVVTRLVEKRLPVIAERIITEEIKKIKAALE